MDINEMRKVVRESGYSIWELIETGIKLAHLECSSDKDFFKDKRDHIVQTLYSCPNCCNNDDQEREREYNVEKVENFGNFENFENFENGGNEWNKEEEDMMGGLFGEEDEETKILRIRDFLEDHHQNVGNMGKEEEEDMMGGLFGEEDEETKILRIRDCLEDHHQSEDSLVELLQTLADMEITFQALKETDIGRHVNRLRKHPSDEVRGLVKELVRKWKDLVDEWVKANAPEESAASALNEDRDSPQHPRKKTQNGQQQVHEFAYSPNSHNGNNSESEPKAKVVSRRDSAAKPPQYTKEPASAPPKLQRQKVDSIVDLDRLASARKRLQENYQEAQNAKKQRKIQVMDIHEIPKPKNGFISRNKGGPQGRHR